MTYRRKVTDEHRIKFALNALRGGTRIRFVEGVSREQVFSVYYAEGYDKDFRIRVEAFLSACRLTRLRKDQKK